MTNRKRTEDSGLCPEYDINRHDVNYHSYCDVTRLMSFTFFQTMRNIKSALDALVEVAKICNTANRRVVNYPLS